jgi:hypothetical protein
MTPSLRLLTHATARTLAVCLTAALVPTLGCGAKTLDEASTDTGNPPVVDIDKVSSVVGGDTVTVSGEKGAATPGGAVVTVTNQRSGTEASVAANQDGSFTLEIAGAPGDTLELEVAGGERTELIQVDAPTTPPVLVTPEKHRSAGETCDEVREAVRPSPDGQPSAPAGDGGQFICPGGESRTEYGECCFDEDCTEDTRGRCSSRSFNYCSYDECQQDSDCTTGGPCVCGEGGNQCLSGNCQVDGDCSGGALCSPTLGTCGLYSGVLAYYCHTPEDACVNDSDCTVPGMGLGYCMYSPDVSHWMCSYTHCIG